MGIFINYKQDFHRNAVNHSTEQRVKIMDNTVSNSIRIRLTHSSFVGLMMMFNNSFTVIVVL